MFKCQRLLAVRWSTIALLAAGTIASGQLAGSALGQGFYFESWGGPGIARGGVSIGIGVAPSSPIPYGVLPSQIFPPLGFRGPYGIGGPVIPDYYRPGDYNRFYQQYRAQLDSPYRYGIDPLQQSQVYGYFRDSAVPPVVAIEPFEHDSAAPAVQQSEASHVPAEQIPQLLRSAAQRLSLALARRGEEGEVWRDYLAPDAIIEALDERTDARQLGSLLLNYDGVVVNGQLRWVLRSDGFLETRQWLRRYIEAADATQGPAQEVPAYEDDPDVPPPPPSPSPGQPQERDEPVGPASPTRGEEAAESDAEQPPSIAEPARSGGISL